MNTTEKYLTIKELCDELLKLGLPHSRNAVGAMRTAGAPFLARRLSRISEVVAWIQANPNFQPCAKRR